MATEDLFASVGEEGPQKKDKTDGPEPDASAPLAVRMRPRNLDDYVGQSHILGPGCLLRRAIESDRVQSIILYGPPGTGKTTLASIIATRTQAHFHRLSGVESNVAELRKVLSAAANRFKNRRQATVLFLDEIHRFNKAQQDVLLPEVENGTIQLIGATTHNPFFFINAPLVSRSQIFELKPLSEEELKQLLTQALHDDKRGLGALGVEADENALAHLARMADGDARKTLNALEIAARTTQVGSDGALRIDLPTAEQSIQRKAVVYDHDEDAHYDTISAYIKSMRGGDPDAALYWLAKMIHAGEDPRFITRRLVICAAEDVGLADSNALILANAAHQASEYIGWPEARIPIAEATLYIAAAPKSNSAIEAIDAALGDIRSGTTLPVPEHLKDAHYGGTSRLGHGQGYAYAHAYPDHFVAQDYLGAFRQYYEPSEQGEEKTLKTRIDQWRAAFRKVKSQQHESERGEE